MSTVAIVQARMRSKRLPGKSNMLLNGYPLIGHVLRRVREAKSIDRVVLALANEGPNPLPEVARDLKIPFIFTVAPNDDLIGRYAIVAEAYEASVIVRVPGDNPCVDPDEIDRIVAAYDVCPTSNLDRDILGSGYPGGLGAEVYGIEFFRWLNQSITEFEYREHPHKWCIDSGIMRTIQCPEEIRDPELRFDVNTQDDFDYISDIYSCLGSDFRARELLEFLKEKPVSPSCKP